MRYIHIHSFSFSGGQQLSLKIKAAGILFNESNISLQNPSLTYLSPTSQQPLNQLSPISHQYHPTLKFNSQQSWPKFNFSVVRYFFIQQRRIVSNLRVFLYIFPHQVRPSDTPISYSLFFFRWTTAREIHRRGSWPKFARLSPSTGWTFWRIRTRTWIQVFPH